jgi:23S rRNA (uracil1939-C5)-methyltransferase
MRAAALNHREAGRAALARVPVALENLILEIESLDAEGRGVAHNAEGKVIFVEGALPREQVSAETLQKKSKYEFSRVKTLLRESSERRKPRCPHFGVCGGCLTQHADARLQMAAKQRALEENLARIGKVQPETMLPIVYGQEWGYRRRARLSVRHVESRGGAMVGFRERRSTHVADMRECHVLPPHISALITPLRALVNQLSAPDRIPQIEVAVGDAASILVFRHLLPLTAADDKRLEEFAEKNGIHVWTQAGGPDSAKPLYPAKSELYYDLPEFGVRIAFGPTDFTQVNHAVNRILVSRAVRLLDPQPGERIGDLFCGLGNFSLPLAKLGAQVIGFEGSRDLIERARRNAAANGLVAQFEVLDLFKQNLAAFGRFDKLLIDPPREGAIDLVKSLSADWPRRIVYVSCDTATLSRDAGVLVHTKGFRLAAAGVANMFPHTAHVESVALFER